MAESNRITSLVDDNDLTTADYLGQFDIRVKQATKLLPPPEIKDEDLKWVQAPAPNAIVWTVGKQWLNNATTFKYFRQYQIIRDFFELRCPFCNPQDPAAVDCWGKSQMYLEDEVLFEWNRGYQDDMCPKCRNVRKQLVIDGVFNGYNQLHGIAGMRSGKTSTASIIATYFEHRLYNFHYSIEGGISVALQQLPSQPFEATFIASSDVQSSDTIWAHYRARRKQSPWIQRYINWIKEIEKRTPTLSGVKATEYRELEKEIINEHLNITFNSMNSNSSGMAGRTRLFACVDELARFQDSESRLSADEAYRVLENSLATVRTMAKRIGLPAWFGSMTSISSPISADDKAMRLIRQAPSIKRMYAFKFATWEFNPFVTREDLNDAFEKDPMGARRDFGADPPAAAAPLVEDPARFRRQAIDIDLTPSCEISYYIKTDTSGMKYRAARMDEAKFLIAPERFICFDAGLTFDTFGGACAHGEWWDGPEGKTFVTVYDWVMKIIPQKYPETMDVWFDSIMDIIKKQKDRQRIARVEFDRWNSALLMQSIRDINIPAESKGTVVTDFVKFVADANLGRIRMLPPDPNDIKVDPPDMSPAGTAFYELEHLERSPDLRKVFNPRKGERIGFNSDDVAQCVVHVHRMVQETVAIDQTGFQHSPEKRLRNEQVGSARWGIAKGGRLFMPSGRLGGRGW